MKVEHVKLNEWKRVEAPGALVADNIGPGICLALYNPNNGKGYMAHGLDVGMTGALHLATKAFIADAIARKAREGATAWLTGAAMPKDEALPTYLDEIRKVEGFRKTARGLLEASGIKIQPILWAEPGQVARFILTIGDDRKARPEITFRTAK